MIDHSDGSGGRTEIAATCTAHISAAIRTFKDKRPNDDQVSVEVTSILVINMSGDWELEYVSRAGSCSRGSGKHEMG